MKNVFVLILLSIFFLLSIDIQAQNKDKYTRKINGKVTLANSKSPIFGVTIKVRGMEFDTLTNSKGEFELDVPKYYISLIFKKVGFKTEEIRIRNLKQETFEVSLQIDESQTGFYSEYTLNSLRNNEINASDMENNFPVGTFENAFSGQFLGVQTTANQGFTNPIFNTNIRGISSVTNGTQPLYVIDGMPIFSDAISSESGNFIPINPLSDILIHEIEQISILKDASATALYGARGANGVILINTKKAKNTQMTFGYYAGITQRSLKPNLLNTSQFMDIYQTANLNEGITNFDLPLGLDSTQLGNTNWEDELSQTGILQNINFTVQKHTKSGNYYTSLNYRNEESYLKNDQSEKINFRFNTEHQFSKKLKIGLNSAIVFSDISRFPNGLKMAYQTPSIFSVKDTSNAYILPNQNPVFSLQNTDYKQISFQLLGNVFGEYLFHKNLKLRTEIGTQQFWTKTNYYQGNINLAESQSFQSTTLVQNTNLNSYLIWKKAFDWHDLQIMAGTNLQKINYDESEINGIGFTNPAQKTVNYSENQDLIYSLSDENRYLSYFTDVQYLFNGTYSAGFTFRADGLNKTGQNQRYSYYPTVSAGWNIFERDTLSKHKFISFLKIHTSYGFTGNSNFSGLNHLGIYEGQANYNGEFGLRPNAVLGNENLSPELTRQIDFSFLYGLFDQNFTGEINYFHRKSSNLILSYSLPYLSGYEVIMENTKNTKLINSGLEFALNGQVDFTENFRWQGRFNITFTKNKVHDLANQAFQNQELTDYPIQNYIIENQAIGVWKLAKWAGIDAQTGEAQIETSGRQKISATPENIAQNLQIMGNPHPTYFGGFQHNFSYNQLKLSLLFTFAGGHQLYKMEDILLKENLGILSQKSSDLLNYWTIENDKSDIPTVNLSENQYQFTSRYLYDADFVRLKSVNLSYDFAFDKSIKFLSIFANIQNAILWTKYPADPEITQNGFQNFASPQNRTFTIGGQIGF